MACIIFSRYGPYHVARYSAARKYLASRGWGLVGIEVANTDSAHYWEAQKHGIDLDIITLENKLDYSALSTRQIQSMVGSALDELYPDVVAINGWSFPEAREAIAWKLENNKTGVLMSTSQFIDYKRVWWREAVKSFLVGCFDSALVGGGSHMEYLVQLGMDRQAVSLGYNVVDNDYFTLNVEKARDSIGQTKKNIDLDLGQAYFYCPSRLIPEKGLDDLLAAYRIYTNTVGNEKRWDLVITGDGPLRETILSSIEKYDLTDKVILRKFIQYEDLPKYYACAGAVILPSRKDTWGLVVNEALASGLPVIVSTACGASKHLVKQNINGLLLEPGDIQELAGCMERISSLGDAEYNSWCKNSLAIIKEWAPDRFAEGLYQAIEKAMERSRRPVVCRFAAPLIRIVKKKSDRTYIAG